MLSKKDASMAQGLAILGMVMLHLFCRVTDLPYNVHFYFAGKPVIYYFALFGDMCVPIYCFCSGYAQYLLSTKEKDYSHNRYRRLKKFIIHYWIILFIFSFIGLVVGSEDIPISFSSFLGNLFVFNISYNGAWWFILTYIFLVLLSPAVIKLVKKLNPVVCILISGTIYFIAYLCEFNFTLGTDKEMIEWFYRQLYLLGRTQFPFIIGMLFHKYSVVNVLKQKLQHVKMKNIILIICPLIMFVFHGIIESLIVSPVTAIVTLTCFHVWQKPQCIEKFFGFLGRHSTNIWLVHMFFYLVLFKDFVFIVKEPILILIFMFAICIAVSYIIDFIEKLINTVLLRKVR